MPTSCRRFTNDGGAGRYGVKQGLVYSGGISNVSAPGMTSIAYRNTSPYYYKGVGTTAIGSSGFVEFTVVHTVSVLPVTSTPFWLTQTEANAGGALYGDCGIGMFKVDEDRNLALADWTISSPNGPVQARTLYVMGIKTVSYDHRERKVDTATAAKALVRRGEEADKIVAGLESAAWVKPPTLEGGATYEAMVLKLPPGAQATFHVHYPWAPKKQLVLATSGKISPTPEANGVLFEFSEVVIAAELLKRK